MPGISEVLMSHYNYTAHCEWKLKEIKIDLQNEFSLGPLLEGKGARRVEQCCTWTPTQRLSVVLGLRLSMVADLGDGWLIDKQRIHGIYSGGEDSCCLWLECVDCAAFAGNKTLWVPLVTPAPTPGAYATVFDNLFCAGDFDSEGTFPLDSRHPSTPASRAVQTGFLVLLDGWL